jgi:hypothetical protein
MGRRYLCQGKKLKNKPVALFFLFSWLAQYVGRKQQESTIYRHKEKISLCLIKT